MKFCTQCIHHESVSQGMFRAEVICCNRKKLIDLTDGSPLYLKAREERKDGEDNCGVAGQFFEPIAKGEEA